MLSRKRQASTERPAEFIRTSIGLAEGQALREDEVVLPGPEQLHSCSGALGLLGPQSCEAGGRVGPRRWAELIARTWRGRWSRWQARRTLPTQPAAEVVDPYRSRPRWRAEHAVAARQLQAQGIDQGELRMTHARPVLTHRPPCLSCPRSSLTRPRRSRDPRAGGRW
jgi:hypothetical protein